MDKQICMLYQTCTFIWNFIEVMIQLSIIHKIVNIKSQTAFHIFVIGHFGIKPPWYQYLYMHVFKTKDMFHTKFVW